MTIDRVQEGEIVNMDSAQTEINIAIQHYDMTS